MISLENYYYDKTVVRKIKIVKKKDLIKKSIINEVSDMMDTCSLSDTEQNKITTLKKRMILSLN